MEEKNASGKAMRMLSITSAEFSVGAAIPVRYTCDGDEVSPPILLSGVPDGTRSLALIMHDPDAPHAGGWTHWVNFNIPPETRVIREGEEPPGVAGANSWGRTGYGGPCPPEGTHRYFFTLYALDTILALPAKSTKEQLETAMGEHILETAELFGLYKRK